MLERTSPWYTSPIVGAAVVGVLIVILLVPLGLAAFLVSEREETRSSVEREVAEKWGGRQSLVGPVLSVPYRYRTTGPRGEVLTHVGQARFLPESLDIEASVRPEIRYRGIYEVALYEVLLTWEGAFERPDFSRWDIAEGDILWRDAVLVVGIPDLRGIRRNIAARWNGGDLSFEPGTGTVALPHSGIHARIPGMAALPAGSRISFSFELPLHGSRELLFAPLGKETSIALSSSWPSPSFTGKFLPDSRRVTAEGFTAEWDISYLTRPYPQQWKDDEVTTELLGEWTGGVELYRPLDSYRKTTRTVKYGVLFLFLTFATYFLFEVLAGLRIHPFQYLLVGFALCLFYLLLLSLSEHVDFGSSYLLASAGTVTLIATYSANVLRSAKRGAVLGGGLAALYGYLYVVMQVEDYALLLGAAGLFLLLSTAMWLTRRVDWYAVGR